MYVADPPPWTELLADLDSEDYPRVLAGRFEDPAPGQYLHWDKLRHLDPPPEFNHEQWWLRLKMTRNADRIELPLEAKDGSPFWHTRPDSLLRHLHRVDQECSGQIAIDEAVLADDAAKHRYLVSSLMEEAIRSSQLEGATSERGAAKDLLRTGRPPRDRSERMITNNYRALNFMRNNMGPKLTPALVVELQRILTEGTLDDPSAAGRFQLPDEERVSVNDRNDGATLHIPPPAEELPARIDALCRFANGEESGDRFVHPVVRALVLHFALGYIHPFEDGNGRTARALFYWSMRHSGYWLVEYLSISEILREAPGQYAKSFLLTESDDGDLTYFLLYQLGVIERAIGAHKAHLKRKMAEVREVEALLRSGTHFNHRQLALLGNSLRGSNRTYTFGSHSSSHGVTHETARNDLNDLAARGLLVKRKHGNQYSFEPPGDLAARLKEATNS